MSDLWAANATSSSNYHTLRDKSLDEGPQPFDIRHVLQSYATYDLPFGRDHALRSGNSVVNGIIAGWTLGGVLTMQSGSPFRLSSGRSTVNGGDSGVVLAPGVTVEDIQKLITISPGPGFNRYFVDPKLIGPDGRANPAYLQVPTEPGKFGQFIYLYGKNTFNLDASLNREVQLAPKTRLTIWIGAFNVLNRAIWTTGALNNTAPGLSFLTDANITSQTFGQVSGPVNSSRSMQVRTSLSF